MRMSPRSCSAGAVATALVLGSAAAWGAGPAGASLPTSERNASSGTPVVVDLRTYSGRWVVPTVEGAVATVARRSGSPVSTSWRLRPAGRASSWVKIVTVTTTDGVPSCLATVEATVALQECTARTPAQRFRMGRADFEDQVTFTGRDGTLNTAPDGSLFLGDGAEPSAVFTLRPPRRAT